jgi:general secretion pathway protein F
MAAFAYKAMTASGRNRSGVMEADTARQVRQLLKDKSLIPLHVEQVAEKEKRSQAKLSLFRPRISATDLALITRQLATLVESGLPVEEALAAVSEQTEKARNKHMLMAVRSKVVEGYSLADALAEFPHIFDDLFRSMVAAGEKSGHLEVVLNRLADYTEKRQQTRSQITQAMVYPMLMMVFALAIVALLLTVVVPKIVGQFDHMGQELPQLTLIMIGISDGLRDYGLYGLLAVMLGLVIFQRMLKTKLFLKRYHRFQLTLPLMGKVIRGLNTARFARTLSILTASAVPLLESMKIAGDVLQNLYIKDHISEAAIKVKEGSSLRAALEQTSIFPPMMMHMIASGERSGELQHMLQRAADNQDREFESLISVSLKVFEPVLIVSMSIVVLFIVMAILQPILALNNMVNV